MWNWLRPHQMNAITRTFDTYIVISDTYFTRPTIMSFWPSSEKHLATNSKSGCIHFVQIIGLVGRAFANDPGDLGSIPGRVITKTLKMVLDTSLLNTQQYKVRIEDKVEQSRKGVAPSPTPRCCSYWKWSFLVALDCGHRLYLLYSISSSSKHVPTVWIPLTISSIPIGISSRLHPVSVQSWWM